jgi:hypothetical protein
MPGKEWKRRRQREQALHVAFVKVLLKSPVKDVSFSKGDKKISLAFSGERASYRILVEREVYVGDWSKRRGELHIDKGVISKGSRSFKALCVHEAVEKFLVERYGLRLDEEAHVVATAKERQYLRRIGGSWKSHQMIVHRLWLKLDGH